MDKDERLKHEEQRKRLWAGAWVAVASSSNCTSDSTCTNWADEALKDFDERFSATKTRNQ